MANSFAAERLFHLLFDFQIIFCFEAQEANLLAYFFPISVEDENIRQLLDIDWSCDFEIQVFVNIAVSSLNLVKLALSFERATGHMEHGFISQRIWKLQTLVKKER